MDTQSSPITFIPPTVSEHVPDLLAGNTYTHHSPLPPAITPNTTCPTTGDPVPGTPCMLGIDEAGRGPVIGPMVYSALYLPLELHHSLLAQTHHFNDSKLLTPHVRTTLTERLCTPGTDLHTHCGHATTALSARDIGAAMLRAPTPHNLNAQAIDATVALIRATLDDHHINLREVYIDTIGPPAAYQSKLARIFPTLQITVEKKADALFPCVSAASVLAKVSRDASCDLLYAEHARRHRSEALDTAGDHDDDAPLPEHDRPDPSSWGSGYPSDARCTAWLRRAMHPLFGWGNECRFSWGTAKDLLELGPATAQGASAIKTDWPGGDDDDNDNHMQLSSYFGVAGGGGRPKTEEEDLRTWFGRPVGVDVF